METETYQEIRVRVSWELRAENQELDGDVFAFLLDEHGNIPRRYDIVFYNLQCHRSLAVEHTGDDRRRTLHQEEILVHKRLLPNCYKEMAILLTIFDGAGKQIHLNQLQKITLELLVDEVCLKKHEYQTFQPNSNSIDLGHLDLENGSFTVCDIQREMDKAVELSTCYGLASWKE